MLLTEKSFSDLRGFHVDRPQYPSVEGLSGFIRKVIDTEYPRRVTDNCVKGEDTEKEIHTHTGCRSEALSDVPNAVSGALSKGETGVYGPLSGHILKNLWETRSF